jgi:acyl-CoA reductase-like NAD-dependent aldehyde dehydrogenase
MNNAGQCCVAAKRFILDETVADKFISRFSKKLAKLIPGDPRDDKTTLGPLCTQSALSLWRVRSRQRSMVAQWFLWAEDGCSGRDIFSSRRF